MGYEWHLDKDKIDLYELKRKMYLAMVTVNILENFGVSMYHLLVHLHLAN